MKDMQTNPPSRGLRRLAKSFAAICGILVIGNPLCPQAMAKDPIADRGPIVGGGPIRYNKYPGTAVIVRVEKTKASNDNKANATEGYEVWFTFTPKGKIPDELGKSYLKQHKEHQFVLGSSGWCPGPKFLKKYKIEKGKKFAATMSVIVEGTTTPVILELDDVPNSDFFEAAPQK